MLKFCKYFIAFASLVFLLTSCYKSMSTGGPGPGDITGAWIRQLSGATGFEGFFLHPDGKLRFINIFSMQGDSWSLKKDKLTLVTHTERYPQPVAEVYRIQNLSDNKMVLTRQDESIKYHRPASGTALLETRWVASFVPGPSAESQPEKGFSFRLRSDGRVEGFAGCNTFRGSYTMSGETLKFSPLISTKMFCPAMAVEDNFFRALGRTDRFLIIEDQLYFYSKNVLQGFFKAKKNQ